MQGDSISEVGVSQANLERGKRLRLGLIILAMNIFKLLPTETVLPEDYPVYYGYVYIMDGVLRRNTWLGQVTVGYLRTELGVKEIRRCEIFGEGRKLARLGDKVEGGLV